MVVTHTHAKNKGQGLGQLVQKLEWKQADGRTRPIVLPASQTWLVAWPKPIEYSRTVAADVLQ